MNTSFGCTAHKQAVEIVRVVACKNYSAALGYVAFAYNRGLENSLEAGGGSASDCSVKQRVFRLLSSIW